jgi:hypothetical protein
VVTRAGWAGRAVRRGRVPAIGPMTSAALVVGVAACGAAPPGADVVLLAGARGTEPTVAVAADGRIAVAWVEARDGAEAGRGDVRVVRLERGSDGELAVGEPVRANDVPGDAAPHEQAPPQVAMDAAGRVYVLWQNNTVVEGRRFPFSDLRFVASADGGASFVPAITVNDDAGGLPASHTFHDLGAGPDGHLYASWIDSRVRARLEAEAGAGGVGGSGHAAHGLVLPGPEIRVARSADDGRSFGPSVVVADGACPCCRTSVAAAADGRVWVAWRTVYAGDIRDIAVARSDDGGLTFGPPVRVHVDGWHITGCPHAGPALAVDGAGRLHVAWYTGAASGPGVYHAVSTDAGRSFGTRHEILVGPWVPPSRVQLATDPAGGVWAAWEDGTGDEPVVRLARLEAGGRAGPIVATHGGRAPALAAGPAGPVLAWLDGEAVRVRVPR